MTIGDTRWEAARGHMTAVQRWGYALSAVRARLELIAGSGRSPLRERDLERLDLDRVVYPDTAAARAAEEMLRALASPSLTNHALRSYVWGSLLGQLDGKRWDEEILFVATALHDLGMTEALHGSCPEGGCFTLDGVCGAERVFALAGGERGERMRRAITLHLNIEVPGDVHGWEAHYVRSGALLDVLGHRHEELPAETLQAVLALHPRLDLKEELVEWVRRESRLRPGSRMGTLVRLGFATLIGRAPFES